MKRCFLCLCLIAFLFAAVNASALPVRLDSPEDLPEVTDDGFLPEGREPVYYKDHAAGQWLYLDEGLRVEITRTQTREPLLTYYLADIQCAPGTSLYTISWNEDKPGRTNGLPQEMAARGNVVYAQSGDFYSYRLAHDRYPGHIVREGKVLYSKSNRKYVTAVPNLATMGFWPSGKAQVNEAFEKTAKEYVEEGASTVLAFGPILIRNEKIQDLDKHEFRHNEPRSCIGYIGPGHFIGLLVEGRKSHSDGADLQTCAEILYEYGCVEAINLDGGNTAAMLFMGESVMLSANGGVDVNDRAIPDILCFGSY